MSRPAVCGVAPLAYSPALDGIRALAALVVVCHHAQVPGFKGGYLGVDVFFVLSGYLITRLLADNRPAKREFYVKRLRRLYPALLAMLAAVLMVAPLFGAPDAPKDVMLAGLYLTDYWRIDASWLGHTWSLAAEEQFYLLWPPLLYFLLRRFDAKTVARFALSAAVYLMIWRMGWEWFTGWRGVYYRLDTHATGLALGCSLALYRVSLPQWAGWAGAGLVVLAMALFPSHEGFSVGITLAEVGAALMIAGNWRGAESLAYLGRLSYGWYLWHYPLVVLALHIQAQPPWPVTLAVAGGGGLAVAALSYHTIEAYFRKPRSGNDLAIEQTARQVQG